MLNWRPDQEPQSPDDDDTYPDREDFPHTRICCYANAIAFRFVVNSLSPTLARIFAAHTIVAAELLRNLRWYFGKLSPAMPAPHLSVPTIALACTAVPATVALMMSFRSQYAAPCPLTDCALNDGEDIDNDDDNDPAPSPMPPKCHGPALDPIQTRLVSTVLKRQPRLLYSCLCK